MSDKSLAAELTTRLLDMTVNEAIRRYPPTVAVFHRYGIDSCCGGALPVRTAAARHGADAAAISTELSRAVAACGRGEGV